MKRKLQFIILLVLITTLIGAGSGLAVAEAATAEIVYLGGTPIGVVAESDGVVVQGFIGVMTEEGMANPAEGKGISVGDAIIEINGKAPVAQSDIADAVKDGKEVTLKLKREDRIFYVKLKPAFDKISGAYKLGLQVKTDIAGVGTLTFVTEDGKSFGGLGHPINDAGASNSSVYQKGSIYPCRIIGTVKGEVGKPGELRGTFVKGKHSVGTLERNNFAGIFGRAEKELSLGRSKISVAGRGEVRPGKAYIYTTTEGTEPKRYEIEIVKAVKQNDGAPQSMVLHVTDPELLALTGGIVQGMSGSPIVQNDKIIGAVTHVFINDPTRGYGIYIDWMLDQIGA